MQAHVQHTKLGGVEGYLSVIFKLNSWADRFVFTIPASFRVANEDDPCQGADFYHDLRHYEMNCSAVVSSDGDKLDIEILSSYVGAGYQAFSLVVTTPRSLPDGSTFSLRSYQQLEESQVQEFIDSGEEVVQRLIGAALDKPLLVLKPAEDLSGVAGNYLFSSFINFIFLHEVILKFNTSKQSFSFVLFKFQNARYIVLDEHSAQR